MYTVFHSVKYNLPVNTDKRKKPKGLFRSFAINTAAFLMAAVLMTGCAGNPDTESIQESAAETNVSDTISFTDDLGREIITPQPRRVIAMIGSFADIWHLAGGEDTLVGTAHDAWTSFDLNLSESVVDLGGVKEPNLEAILAAQPDFILASIQTTANLELMETFEQAGIPVAYFEVSGFDDYLRMLKICTELTGKPEYYTTNGSNVDKQVSQVLARQTGEAPKVLCIRATGSSCKVKNSTGTVLGEMLHNLGCVNIADSDASLLENLSMESIIAADPDYIFVVLQGADATDAQQTMEKTLLANPAWNHLRAVQNGNFHVMEHRLYNLKPNARWGYAYEKLADILYPETK